MVRSVGVAEVAAIIVVALLSPAVIPSASAAADPYYAGYFFCSPPDTACSNTLVGIRGSIYTINPYVPYFDDLAQWVTVVFSYSTSQWVQVGYVKCGGLNVKCAAYTSDTYYCEYYNGQENVRYFGNPSPGSTYSYNVLYQNNYDWSCTPDSATGTTWSTAFSEAVDLQAFSETTNTCIVIANTHFSGLQLQTIYLPGSWLYWTQHAAHADSPYTINQISDTEFTAAGGTGC